MNEKEKKLLESWSKLLGNPEVPEIVYVSKEEIQEKENKLIRSFEQMMTEVITPKEQPPVVEEAPPIVEDTFADIKNDNTRKIKVPNSQATPVQPQPELPQSFVDRSMAAIAKTTKKPEELDVTKVDPVRLEIQQMKQSITDLHHFASRISQMGGGGAGTVNDLTYRTVLATQNYVANKHDYYIGVNCPTSCTITLPSTKKNGTQVVVKDESGNCSINRITIVDPAGSSIDNTTQAIMAINNMSLTFIYRNGWRII
jgi:hypothetical protein